MTVLLRVAYDGTDFHGYAAQGRRRPGAEAMAYRGAPIRCVQSDLEQALATLYKQGVLTRAASRTDAGVHARGQLVAFDAPFEIPLDGLMRGINSNVAPDVRVWAAWEETRAIDVRRDNLGKHYAYCVGCTPVVDPLRYRYEWHIGRALDLVAMRQAAAALVGQHDFSSFRGAGCQAVTTVRTVTSIEVIARAPHRWGAPGGEGPAGVEVHVRGRGFLYNMVRIMAGTLVEVGRGRRASSSLADVLRRCDRRRAGMTAPARGLTLVEVLWPASAVVSHRSGACDA